jgi:putative ABC transport system permease protein
MFKNYFKTAIRNLKRYKGYAFINILGLAVGIAACLLIFLVIQFETSFDNFHPNSKNIYRVVSEFNNPDGKDYSSGVPFPVAPALRLDFPQLKRVGATMAEDNEMITVPQEGNQPPKKFKEERGIFFAEPEVFGIFNFPLLAGDIKSALKEPNAALLTQETATRYFGDWKSAMGKTIVFDNKTNLKVSGILKDISVNTDFPFKVVGSYSTLKSMNVSRNLNDWVSTFSSAYTFIELPDKTSREKFDKLLAGFVKKHKPVEYAKDGMILQPLKEMHFDDRFGNYRSRTFSRDLIKALALIGVFLLLIACVNFINLATAQAVNRSKEVGIRKVMGSNRRQLSVQFLSESVLITLLATAVAIGIALLTLPLLRRLLEVPIQMDLFNNPMLILFVLTVTIVVSLLSGTYPSFILSRFNPITALKTKVSSKLIGGISLRRGLVVLQFTIAHTLIIGTLIVVSQMDYFRTASLGFSKESILTVSIPSDSVSATKMNAMRNQLLENPQIKSVTFSFASPSDNPNWASDFKFEHSPKSTDFSANLKWADPEYFKTYNLQFVAGRPYYLSDTVKEFVVNETLVRKLGFHSPQEIIGKQLDFWDGRHVARVVGVVRDFHVYSLRDPLSPVVMSTWKNLYQTIGIKITAGDPKPTLAAIEKLWNDTYPEYVYESEFLDKKIANFYRQENQLSQLYKIFAAIAIFISCLGLYGLVSFMAVQRTKEVGIRKVLGAGVGRIVLLFSREFTFLIGIAFIIATPVAYYFMKQWLQNYTYRINLGASIFIIAILFSIVIAWLTVGWRAIRAAQANPVKSLRTE